MDILQEQEISQASIYYWRPSCRKAARVCFGGYWAFEVLVLFMWDLYVFQTALRDDGILFQAHLPHLQTISLTATLKLFA